LNNFSITRRRATTRTFRIDRDIDEKLRALADEEHLSVNTVASRALRRYIDWDLPSEKTFQCVTISTDFLKRLIDNIPQPTLKQIGHWMGEQSWVFSETMFHQNNLAALIASLELSYYSKLFSLDHTQDKNLHRMVLAHSLGPNWSILLDEYITAWLKTLSDSTIEEFKVEHAETHVLAYVKVKTSPQPQTTQPVPSRQEQAKIMPPLHFRPELS
jgi:hypothetical protein